MPIEIIKRIQQERAEEAARQEKARQEVLEKERLANEEKKRLEKEAEERRLQFVISKNNEIVGSSNILHCLERIDKEMLDGNVKSHQLKYVASTGRIALVWGTSFKIGADGKVDSNHTGSYDYSSIEIQIAPDNESISINAQALVCLQKQDWQNANKLEEVLAKAYIDPSRKVYDSNSSYSSSDHDSDVGCCCCSAN